MNDTMMNTTEQYNIDLLSFPQELLIQILSFMFMHEVSTIGILNHSLYEMVHNTANTTSEVIWRTIFQTHFNGEEVNTSIERTFKELVKEYISARFESTGTNVLSQISSENWKSYTINFTITLDSMRNRSICWEIVLDEYSWSFGTSTTVNYYSVIVGVIWHKSNITDSLNPSNVLGHGNNSEAGFVCANKGVMKGGRFENTEFSKSEYQFPDNEVKSGDVVGCEVKVSPDGTMFTIIFYLNAEEMCRIPDIPAAIVKPAVSLCSGKKISVRRVPYIRYKKVSITDPLELLCEL
jgi:hypothetical protein